MARSESESSRSRGNRDMLSRLPDSLLHHIMLFMPAWQDVQLCVLSKRWKTLWTTLPVLNCGFNKLRNNQPDHYVRVKSLAEFVSTVLLLREATSHLHTFTLDCDCRYFGLGHLLCTSIRPWIRYAIERNLRVLTINIKISKTIIFPSEVNKAILYPSEVFTYPSLEQVTLSSTRCIDTPEIINLPSLKWLHLKNAELNQDFMSKLLRGCPVLEDLHVEDGSVEVSDITSHSLKHLKIMTEYHQGLIELINAPNLLSFHFVTCCCCQAKEIILNMPSLSEAYIEFALCSYEKPDETKSSNILYGLFNVHRLELKGNFHFSQDYLEAEISNCRTFSKLTCLSVSDLFLNCHFDLLSSLLEHCPNLKKLSLVHYACPTFCQLFDDGMTESAAEVIKTNSESWIHLDELIKKQNCPGWLSTTENVIKHIGVSRARNLEAEAKEWSIAAIKLRVREEKLMMKLFEIVAGKMASE